jgi:hypothetical protein
MNKNYCNLSNSFVDQWNQVGMPASASHAVAGMFYYQWLKKYNTTMMPSRLFLHNNAKGYDNDKDIKAESTLENNLKVSLELGVPNEMFYPYTHSLLLKEPPLYVYHKAETKKATSILKINVANIIEVKNILIEYGPIAFTDFLNHSKLIIGFDQNKEFVLIRDSKRLENYWIRYNDIPHATGYCITDVISL